MAEPITLDQLKNASLDAKTLEAVVNGDDNTDVTSRLGATYPTLDKALKMMLKNGLLGATPFDTYEDLLSSDLPNDSYATVTHDVDLPKNGLYKKMSDQWSYSGLNPVTHDKSSNIIQNGNLSSLDGVVVYADKMLSSSDTSELVVVENELNSYGCNHAFKLHNSGAFIHVALPAANAEFVHGHLVSVLIYSESGNFNGVSASAYQRKTTASTGGTMNFATHNMTMFRQLNSQIRQYYVYINFARNLHEDERYSEIILGARSNSGEIHYLTGFWASVSQSRPISITDTRFPFWTVTANTPASNNIKALKQLYHAMYNPMHSINIRFIGDSITWGVGATGTAQATPRSHSLSDPRNNMTSDSYVNLFRLWLGQSILDGAELVEELNEDKHTGSAYFFRDYIIDPTDTSNGFRYIHPRLKKEIGMPKVTQRLGTTFGYHVDIAHRPSRELGYNYNAWVEFDFVGDNFTAVYAGQSAINSDKDTYVDVYIDNEKIGEINYSEQIAFNLEKTYNVEHGKHTASLRNRSENGSAFRLEAIKVTRKIRVANDGISGTWTGQWLPNGQLLGTVTDNDEFVFVQLGTNDRSQAIQPFTMQKTKNNLDVIVKHLLKNNKKVVLMAANSVRKDKEDPLVYKYTQGDIAQAVKQVADKNHVSFVDNYRSTIQDKIEGNDNAYTTDGLHPNDAGHRKIFENIVHAIMKQGE